MYATDAVAATKRQEAAAERTTRQTALSFTRELVQKRERAAVAAAETAAAYAEAQAEWERSIVAWEGAQHGLEAAGSMALANREVAATRLVEAQHDMVSTGAPRTSSHSDVSLMPMRCCGRQVQREAAAEHAAATARSTAVELVEPFGSLLIAITAPSASDLRNRESIEAATALLSTKNYAEALVQLNDVLAEPDRLQPAEAAELYEMRAVCYKSLSCFDDAEADQQAAQQRLAAADSQGDAIADTVLGICGSGGGDDDDEAAPDPCLEVYVALATANLFEGFCRTASDHAVREALLRIARPCADACHDRRPRDWLTLDDGRRVRWLSACHRAARTAAGTAVARKRLLSAGIVGACSHVELFAFVVAIFAVLREVSAEDWAEEHAEVARWSLALLNRHPDPVPLDDSWAPKFLRHDSVEALRWALGRADVLNSPVFYEQACFLPMLAWACHDSPLLQDAMLFEPEPERQSLLANVFAGIQVKPASFSANHALYLLKSVAESEKEPLIVEMMRVGAVATAHALLKDIWTRVTAENHGAEVGLEPETARLAAGFTKAAAAHASSRVLLLAPSTLRQFHEMLDIIASTEDSETHFECMKVAELLVGRELDDMDAMAAELEAMHKEAHRQAEETAERRANLEHLAVAGEKLEASAQRSLDAMNKEAHGGAFLRDPEVPTAAGLVESESEVDCQLGRAKRVPAPAEEDGLEAKDVRARTTLLLRRRRAARTA